MRFVGFLLLAAGLLALLAPILHFGLPFIDLPALNLEIAGASLLVLGSIAWVYGARSEEG